MIPWAVVPPEGSEPAEPPGSEGAEERALGPEEPVRLQVLLGVRGGVPVWVEGERGPGGTLVVRRLVATDPELYLWPALAPGAALPLR